MGSFASGMKKWTDKAKRNVNLIVFDSFTDVVELMTRRQPSVKELGGFSVGFVPVDQSELINSLQVSVNDLVTASGEGVDISSALATAPLGSSLEAAFTAPHAPAMEYGTKYTDGRFFVRNAVQKWEQIVSANAARYK